MPERTLQSVAVELAALSANVEKMGGLVEAAVTSALTSVVRRHTRLAQTVLERRHKIKVAAQEVEKQAVRILALYQPVADDLRHVLGSWRIASELSRIGELATNIAERCIVVNGSAPVPLTASVERMGKIVLANLKQALDSYANRDAYVALHVWMWDEDVDSHFSSIFRELLTHMMADSRVITPCAHLLFVAKHLERIGDHSTNIAERVHFIVTGNDIAGERPKGEQAQEEEA